MAGPSKGYRGSLESVYRGTYVTGPSKGYNGSLAGLYRGRYEADPSLTIAGVQRVLTAVGTWPAHEGYRGSRYVAGPSRPRLKHSLRLVWVSL